MGLQYSADRILGWRSQHDAMVRWHKRCEALHRPDDTYKTDFTDALDHILVFFILSYHIRDFVLKTRAINLETFQALFRSDVYMPKCRDIANRIKHHTLSHNPSVDGDWSVAREYEPFGASGERIFFVFGSEKINAMDLVRGCVRFWEHLIEKERLKEPNNPFA